MTRSSYFAYGSNLDAEVMKIRCPEAAGVSPACLADWRIVPRGFADIEKAAGNAVYGALYSVTARDLESLDRCEGAPEFYERRAVQVVDQAGVYRRAWVYTMTERYKLLQDALPYTEEYRALCAAGAEAWGIPNAFTGEPETRHTLFEQGVPEIPEGLAAMLAHVDSGAPLPRAVKLWIGARVVITLKARGSRGDFGGFYPAPFEVATPHARELSWVFCDLRDLFVTGKWLNSTNKFTFYRTLAESAAQAAGDGAGAREMCRRVIQTAQAMYAST